MTTNAISVWDFTIPEKSISKDELIKEIKNVCKAWAFQIEKGKKTGYLHYQGRVSLKVKSRVGPNLAKGVRWSATSEENKTNMFYVIKDDTRIAGPWTDKDKEIYLPRQFRDINLYEWQSDILESRNIFQDRIIDAIYDVTGNNGKSTVAALGEIMYGGIDCPPINDCKELIQYVCNHCMDNEIRDPKLLFVDLPRAMNKESLFGIYSAIEQIKKGKLTDTRHHAKVWWIDSPRIWIFTNHLPDLTLLSSDRWRIWTINKKTNKLDRFLGDSKESVTIAKKRILK